MKIPPFFSHTSRADRDFEKLRSRFGMTDAERRERTRREYARNAFLQFLAVLVLALIAISHLQFA